MALKYHKSFRSLTTLPPNARWMPHAVDAQANTAVKALTARSLSRRVASNTVFSETFGVC